MPRPWEPAALGPGIEGDGASQAGEHYPQPEGKIEQFMDGGHTLVVRSVTSSPQTEEDASNPSPPLVALVGRNLRYQIQPLVERPESEPGP